MAPHKSPAFQFYPKDFVAGTATMSNQEVGAYMRLLCYAWDACGVPNDARERSRIICCSLKQERTLWHRLERKFALVDGVYVNERMEQERQKQADYRRRQSDKGKASAIVRWQPEGNRKVTTVTPRLQPDGNSSSSSSSSSLVQEQIPPRTERAREDVRFAQWWSAYPKKVSKGQAIKAWSKLKPDQTQLAQMLDALRWQVRQPAWTKDGGAYIPHPATYLNAQKFLDEPSPSTTSVPVTRFAQLGVSHTAPETATQREIRARVAEEWTS